MDGELRRLRRGPGPEDDGRCFLVRVRFGAEDADRVIAVARAALACVVERTGDWPAFEQWSQLLPAPFLQRCAPEHGEPEPGEPFDLEAWEQQWAAMTPDDREAACAGPWTLSDWLYTFDPTEDGAGHDRSWWWWDAGTDGGAAGGGSGWVQVATTGWPFGSASLSWLIEASGGRDLVYGS